MDYNLLTIVYQKIMIDYIILENQFLFLGRLKPWLNILLKKTMTKQK